MFDWKKYENDFLSEVQEPIEWLSSEFAKLRVGRASPLFLDDVRVEAYGEHMQINQIANISIPGPRTLVVKPYDKTNLKIIAGAINSANLGVNPQVDADLIRITFSAPTEESRKNMVKKAKGLVEETKVKIRRIRQDLNDFFKKEANLVDDDKKYFQTQLDNLTKQQNQKIDELFAKAEIEIMKI